MRMNERMNVLLHAIWKHGESEEDLLNKPVLMLDGAFGVVIRTPTENHDKLGIQVPGEEDIRWRDPAKVDGNPLRECCRDVLQEETMTEKEANMRLRVELREGENPRTYDVETGEDLTDRVMKIEINPIRRANAVLYKERHGVCPYVDEDTLDAAVYRIPVERIEGTWVTGGPNYVPCGRGMDNFNLSAARKALIRLQNLDNPKGWKNEEMKQLNIAMEALFPGEEGNALHKQMTQEIEQKKA